MYTDVKVKKLNNPTLHW